MPWGWKSSIPRRIFPFLSHNICSEEGMMTEEAQVKHIQLNPIPGMEFETDGIYIRKKTYAILLSFNGQSYQGMQVNRVTGNAIENYLLAALLSLTLITEEEATFPQLFKFQRTSRTDKGVSAARMVVSAVLPEKMNTDNLKCELNNLLSEDIRVMAVYRVIRSFNSKLWCDGRSYSYLCPTFAFAPITERACKDYRISDEVLGEVRRQLNLFKGSHNFHNFTSKIGANDARAWRVINSVECDEPFERHGWQWINIKLRGQSFLLHQIRKMVCVLMCVCRGLASPHFITSTLTTRYVDLPKAPALGLVLQDQHFVTYNKTYGGDGIHEPLVWDEVEEEIQRFCDENLYDSIMKKELNENVMLKWLCCQYYHDYQTYILKHQAKQNQDINHQRFLQWKHLSEEVNKDDEFTM
ncbi:hypothetical protein Pmani_018077 [Petrolisthes manimaculis]|uniref:Pseudouridylate synthase 1 homolog n=1 Tax=Petrolisthes manimaculis TaxID=1843537 RepID=A0AAE1PN80_9EUCA|nr:hypothetical protein Pmani_018077 [Petrolisthes manimaculis]